MDSSFIYIYIYIYIYTVMAKNIGTLAILSENATLLSAIILVDVDSPHNNVQSKNCVMKPVAQLSS